MGGQRAARSAPTASTTSDPLIITALLSCLTKSKSGTSNAGGVSALHVLASQMLQQLVACNADVTLNGDDGDSRASSSSFLSLEAVRLGHTLGSLVCRLPALQPQRDLRPPISDMDVIDAYGRSVQLESSFRQSKCNGCGRWPLQWGLFSRVQQLSTALSAVRKKYSIEALALYPEM